MRKLLIKLHRWNAYAVLVLSLSGILLSIGTIRGDLGVMRVVIREIHIWVGVISIALLLIYFSRMANHLKQIRKKKKQLINLSIVLFLLAGWILSGIVLWQYRHLPTFWNNDALVVHDVLTWIGIPYALFHSVTRLRWLRKPALRTISAAGNGEAESKPVAAIRKPLYSRRQFVKWAIGIGITAAAGPFFIRFLRYTFGSSDNFSSDLILDDKNQMVPAPEPMPASSALIGGGSKGQFRIYTVTDIPTFTSDNWVFSVKGLVNNQMTLSWEQFLQIKRQVQVSDFHCVTGWSVYSNTWEGIPLVDLLTLAGVKQQAKFVKFYSGDKVYTDYLTLQQANMSDVMVAVLHDGKPIPQAMGGPVRLVVPKMYGYKSVKWLESIELVETGGLGYWEQRGYDTDAWLQA
ncbi:MAG: oxidoreductase [Bacilli bacterium]|nr:oxidoreductase [Bacilli bacterium]